MLGCASSDKSGQTPCTLVRPTVLHGHPRSGKARLSCTRRPRPCGCMSTPTAHWHAPQENKAASAANTYCTPAQPRPLPLLV